MKRIVDDDNASGLEALLGEKVLLICANYFYSGKLTGVNKTFVELEDAGIVYETGSWAEKGYTNLEKFHTKKWFVETSFIESYGLSK